MSLFVYVFALAVTLVFSYFYLISNNSQKQLFQLKGEKMVIQKSFFFLVFAFLPLWILISFRDISVGTDTRNTYFKLFQFVINGNYENYGANAEKGYLFLIYIIALLSDNYFWCIFFVGTLCWLLFFIYIIRDSKNVCWSILLFFLSYSYFHMFNGVRQYLATGIVLLSFYYIYERKLIKFLLLILLASTVHSMILVFIPFYFLYDIKLNIKRTIIILIVSTLAFSSVWRWIISVFSGSKYEYYLGREQYFYGYTLTYILIAFTVLVIGLFIKWLYNIDDKKYELNLWMQLCSLIVATNAPVIPEPHRIYWIFSINTMIFSPLIVSYTHDKRKKIIIEVIITGVVLLDFLRSWFTGMDQVQKFMFWQGI